ncbi:MAG: RNA polymerase sigma factor [Pirellulales bacterium]|nr:RNA polymerase sigma factor [Pirellulales bacterium]
MDDWAAILKEHGPRVWRTVYRILSHFPDAEDCYQDTFAAAWQFSQNRAVVEWAPFLTCLATRKAIDRLRSRVREDSKTERLNGCPESVAAPHNPLQTIQMAELLDRVRRILPELPDKQAEVFWLACVEELSNAQIAERLQIPGATVRVLLHRARTRQQLLLGNSGSPVGAES